MSDFSFLTKSIVKNMSDKNNEKIETATSQIITQVKETVVKEVIHDTLNVDLSGLATKDEVAQSKYDDTAIQTALEDKVNIDIFTAASSEINDKLNTQNTTLMNLDERIATLENKPDYDDTDIKESLALKADKSDLPDITLFMISEDIVALVNDNKYDDTAIQSALLKKANSNDVYTTQQVDDLLNNKANIADIPDVSEFITGQDVNEIIKANKYDDTEIKASLLQKANTADVYTKQETYSVAELMNLFNVKANVSDIPDISDLATKQEVIDSIYDDTNIKAILANKADKSAVYAKQETYSAIELTTLLATKANVNDIPDISDLATKQEVIDSVYDDTAIQDVLIDKANKNDVYTKEEVVSLLEAKANLEDVYRKVDTYSAEKIQELLDLEANKDSVYTISQVDELLNAKANVDDIPDISNLATKQEVIDSTYDDTNIQTTLANKADKSDVYTIDQVEDLLDTKANIADIPDISDLATKQEVNDSIYDDTAIQITLANKANSSDVYTTTVIDELLNAKVNVSVLNDLATKQEVADSVYDDTAIQNALSNKANKDLVYTISQVDGLLSTKANVSDIPDITSLATKQEVIDSIYDDSAIQDALLSKADKSDVYSKEETTSLLAVKADNANIYTTTQIDNLLNNKIDKNAVYTITQVDDLLDTKANSSDISNLATKQEVIDSIYDDTNVQTALSSKADKNNVYTKEEVVSLLEAKANLEDVYKKVDTYSAEKIQELLDLEANKDSVYTISQVDNLLSAKANNNDIPDISNLATKQEVIDSIYDDTTIQNTLLNKADKSDVYSKGDLNSLFIAKANVEDVYSKTAIQDLLDDKANKDDVYSISQVDDLLNNKANINDIPDISNLATKQEVIDSTYDDTAIQETLTNKADKSELPDISQFMTVAAINELVNANKYNDTAIKESLITKANTNDVYNKNETLTTSAINALLSTKANIDDIPDISNLATKQEVIDSTYDDTAIQEALSDRYTKEEVVSLLEAKANLEDVYKKVDTYSAEKIQELLDLEANKDSVYTISQVDNLLSTKANVSDIPDISNLATKQEVIDSTYDDTAIQEALLNKADKSALEILATKEELSNKIEPDALNDYVAKSTLFTNNGSGVFNAGWEAADGSSHYFTAKADNFGGIFSYNAANNVSSFVGLNKSPADFSDVDFQLYAKDETSNIGVRLNGSATKGLFYLKNSTNLGFPTTREIATLEDIPDVSQFLTSNDIINKADKSEIPDVSALASKQEVSNYVTAIQTEVAKKINQTQLFKNNVFSYTQSDDDGSYNTFFTEKNSGGGNQYFNALTNTLSYLGVNKPSTIGSDVDVQLYSKDKNTNIGTRLNMSATKGMYYLKNSGNLGFPAGREIAVLDDIPDISGKADSDDVYTRAEIDNKLSDKIDVSKVWNGSGNYFQTKYTHNDGSYAQLWNEADGGGSQYLHAPADIISYVGTNDDGNTTDANNDSSAICVQLYSKYKEGTKPNSSKNYGTRLNVNPQKIYYTKGTDTSANGGSEDNELAVIGDVKALLARVEELEAKVAALENA